MSSLSTNHCTFKSFKLDQDIDNWAANSQWFMSLSMRVSLNLVIPVSVGGGTLKYSYPKLWLSVLAILDTYLPTFSRFQYHQQKFRY